MKTHLDELNDGIFDQRFTKRFLDFVPVKDWPKYGFELEGVDNVPEVMEWTEKNILDQLRNDVEFGIEKATCHRGISAALMDGVVRAWCIVLENGLENTPYGYYGDKLFKAVDEKYGFGLVDENTFDEQFYENW